MRHLATLLLAATLAGGARAQTGRIAGLVLDAETRRPLPGASVLIAPTDRGDVTDMEGRFAFGGLSAGRYTVYVRFLGFEPVARPDVEVVPGRASMLEIVLHPAVYETEEVVVHAGWFEEARDEPAPVILFSSEEVRRAAGAAGDVQRLLAGLPSVSRMDDMRNALAVRGGSPLETRFVVDGIPIPNINHFPTQGASGGALGIVAADLIGDVTFRPGGFGPEHGDRLGAVVDLDLRAATDRDLAFRGDFSIAGTGLFAEGSTGNRRFTWLSGFRRSWVDLLVTGFLEEQADAVPTYSDAIVRAVWRPSAAHEVLLLDLAAIDRSGIDRSDAIRQNENHYGSADFDANTAGLRWTAFRGSRGFGATTLSHAWSGRRFVSSRTSTGTRWLDDRTNEHSLRLSHIERIMAAPDATIDVGFDIDREFGRYRTHMVESDLRLQPRAARTRLGVHASLGWRLLASVRVQPGFRIDHAAGHTRVQPRASLQVRVRPDVSLRLAGGLYVQQLPLALLAQSPHYDSLPPPEALHWIAGLSWEPAPAVRLAVDAYAKRYRRLPQDPSRPYACALDLLYDDALSMPLWPAYDGLSSNGIARARGLEVSVQQRLARRIYGLVSVGINRSEYRDMGGTWRPRLFENRLVATIDGGFRPNDRHQIGIRFTFAGGRPFTPFDEVASRAAGTGIPDMDRIQGDRLPDYHALSIRYDRRFTVAEAWVVGYLSVWNVYDRRNLSGWYWDEIRETVRERVQWGILPVIGFEVVFR